MHGRMRGVTYQEVHRKVVLQSPALYQSFGDPPETRFPDPVAVKSLRVPHHVFQPCDRVRCLVRAGLLLLAVQPEFSSGMEVGHPGLNLCRGQTRLDFAQICTEKG